MDKQEFRKNAGDMMYLAACAINGKTPSKARVDKMDLQGLYEVCENHILTAICAYGLEAAGVRDHNFTQSKEKSIRKNILLDADRCNVLRRLEAEGIWYMPLKGALLKDWYPKLGMRQMSDNDILFDAEKRQRVREIMEELGFTCDHYGNGWDDAYFKEPVSNFEMHNALFAETQGEVLVNYFTNVKDILIKDDNSEYGYHFSNEDFYIYLIAHEYKHFVKGGTGVRSLLDIYVYMNTFCDLLDWEHINTELAKLGMLEFEQNSRSLAMKLFSFQKLTNDEKKLLDYFATSGVYGSFERRVENLTKAEGSKLGYVMSRVFPPMSFIKTCYPFYYEHKYLLPVLFVKRLFRAAFISRKKIKNEIGYISKQ